MIQEPLLIPQQIQQVQGLQQQKLQTGYLTGYETQAYHPIPIQLNSHLNSPKILLIASPAIVTQSQSIKTNPRKRIIRVPFLPRSVPTQHLVKQSLPIENGLVKNSNPNTVSQVSNDTQENLDLVTENILTNTHYYYSSSKPIESEHCYQILYPTTKSCHQTQPIEQSKSIKQPLTLASMAGIQLTGSDESPMEMSGATPPIATVEEINVPVFIDEYLQQLTQTSTTTAATFITNSTINDNNINNNHINGYANICLQEGQQQQAEEEEEEESFETLEFDIEMIAEDNNKIGATIENINNINNNSNSSNNIMDYYYMNSDANNTYNNHNNNNFNTNNFCEAVESKEEPQYLISPGMVHYNLSEDTASFGLEPDDIVLTEEAIDISSMNNDHFTFSEVFCSSQNDPMLSAGLDNFSQKITDAEPVIPNIDYDAEYAKCIKQQQIKQEDLDVKFELSTTTPFVDTPAATPKSTVPSMVATPPIMKRRRTTSRGMIEKRRKLHLNTSAKNNIAAVPDALNTPDVVNLIADWGKQEQPHLSFGNSATTENIINELLNMCNSTMHSPLQANADTTCWTALIDNSSSSSTIGTIINNNSNSNDSYAFNSNNTNAHTDNRPSVATSPASSSLAYNDEDPPYTPQSFISSTNQTGDFTTSPNSPALSTSTTTTTQTKKRGRPSKEHSDKPDPARLEHLPEAERKKAEDRAKNNEASRLSRLKNKLKEEAEVEEARKLTERNIEMKAELERLNKISTKLKRALQRRHFRTQ